MAKITDLIEEQGGEEQPVNTQETVKVEEPQEDVSMIGDREARMREDLKERNQEQVEGKLIVEEEPLTEQQQADVHGIPVDELRALNKEATYVEAEAEAAIGIRPKEEDVLAQKVYRGEVEAEGQSPEVLQRVDELQADAKRRAENETISGTMTQPQESLLAQASDVVAGVAETVADTVRGVERSGWKKALPLQINHKTDSPETKMADDFYQYLVNNNLFNSLGVISPEELEVYIPSYIERISNGSSTKELRVKWMNMVTRGIAMRNGLHVADRATNDDILLSREGVEDLANGISIYKKQSDGRIPTARFDSQGNQIPFTTDEIKKIESELEAVGVYDPLVRSQYRSGLSKKKIESLTGMSEALNWIQQAGGVAFNKLGIGLEPRYEETVPAMVGEIAPIVFNIAVGNKALGVAKIGELGKLGTLTKIAALESNVAVTDYYMAPKGQRYQSLEGVIQQMNLSQIEKEELGAYASLQPLLKFADNYAKDSKFVITGADDVDSAALKQMGSGLKISGILTATGFGIAAARVASKPLTKAAAKQLAKLKVKEGLKLSAKSVAIAAKELGLSARDAVRAFDRTIESLGGASPQRGAIGGRGRLPQFGRGADEGVEGISIPKGEKIRTAPKTLTKSDIKRLEDCQAKGNCIENSIKTAEANEHLGARVIQGEVYMPEHEKQMMHSWVEIGDMVYDPTQDFLMPKSEFYSLVNATVTNDLTAKEAKTLATMVQFRDPKGGLKVYTPEEISEVRTRLADKSWETRMAEWVKIKPLI